MKKALLFLNACIFFQGMTFAMEEGMKDMLVVSANYAHSDSSQPIYIQAGKKIFEFAIGCLVYEGIRKIVNLSSTSSMQTVKLSPSNTTSCTEAQNSNQQENAQPYQSQISNYDNEIKPEKMEEEIPQISQNINNLETFDKKTRRFCMATLSCRT